jgi:L-asparaginase
MDDPPAAQEHCDFPRLAPHRYGHAKPEGTNLSVLLIHTGGTIGMVATVQGFAPGEGVLEGCAADMIARGEVADAVTIRALTPQIDSANATPEDWNRVMRLIEEGYDSYDAFVVTHGTDTLAYTAAALCFGLEGLGRPVIVTGSMLPLSVPGSDGRDNLRAAFAAGRSAPPGVWVQFAGKRLHGARVRKSHSRHFDAFAAEPTDVPPRHGCGTLRRHPFGRPDVAILAFAPGVSTRVLRMALGGCDGIVLRCYGSGTAPDHPDLVEGLRVAAGRAIPVVAVSQCPEGGMALGTYAAGAVLSAGGVIDGRDMTVEAAYAKLMFALSVSADPDRQQSLLRTALCGEFTAAAG